MDRVVINLLFIIEVIGAQFAFTNCNTKQPEKQKDENSKQVGITPDTSFRLDTNSTGQHNTDSIVNPIATHADSLPVKSAPPHTPLTLLIKNLVAGNGPIVVGVFSRRNKFPDESDQFRTYRFPTQGDKALIQIKDLDYGEFALAIYQDVNDDGIINTIAGIPKEPYAFSNNYKPLVHAPKFDDCAFAYTHAPDTLVISMIRWP